jgi:hypothetical protein
MGIALSVTDEDQTSVLTGKATITFPLDPDKANESSI